MLETKGSDKQNLELTHSQSRSDIRGSKTRSGGDFTGNASNRFKSAQASSESLAKLSDGDLQTIEGSDVEHSGNYQSMGTKLKVELSRYKQELSEYNNTTKHLEKKYKQINTELNAMQMKHEHFLAKRNCPADTENESSSTSVRESSVIMSDYSVKTKYTQVFQVNEQQQNQHRHQQHQQQQQQQQYPDIPSNYEVGDRTRENSLILAAKARKQKPIHSEYGLRTRVPTSLLLKRRKRTKILDSCSRQTLDPNINSQRSPGLRSIYKTIRTIMDEQQKQQQKHERTHNSLKNKQPEMIDLFELQQILTNLQSEQTKSNALIQQQQKCLQDYHNRCLEAQTVVKAQRLEIVKLQNNNEKLETEFSDGIDQMRKKIDAKLREVSMLPKRVREERDKSDKIARDNKCLNDRVRVLQQEAYNLKAKLDEISRRKTTALARLKTAERDLKIFKNHNLALKNEKKRLHDELDKLKEQLALLQNNNKRLLNKQREQFERQRRELQKRIYDSETKLNRAQRSTSSIVQERDALINELQTQLNTLVHNFEVSQKHIRVLRRHIYSMPNGHMQLHNISANNTPPATRLGNNGRVN